MSDGGLTSGDPLGGGPARRPEREVEHLPSGLPSPGGGYLSPPPPGAGGTLRPEVPGSTGALVLAGWWRRVGAALIDGVIVGVIALILFAVVGAVFAGLGLFEGGNPSDGSVVGAIVTGFLALLVLVAAGFLYAPLLMAKTNGQTLGRMATGIRVVRTSGQAMSFGWAMLREVAVKGLLINAVGASVTFGLTTLLDILWPLWDEENRALHDFVVQTRTVMA